MSDVVLCECFARDGLQHETQFVPTPTKQALVERFATLGFQRVEATSYSNPKVVPQFADASALLQSLSRRDGVHYKATCANVRAVERALADLDAGFGVTEISLLVSASEAHSQKNLRQSRADQWDNVRKMAAAAQGRFRLIGTISVAFGCPFEGAVDPGRITEIVSELAEAAPDEIVLADTIGVGTPTRVRTLVAAAVRVGLPIGVHLHNTRNTGYANAIAALEAGASMLDASIGGIGGCPFAPRATGNIATEDLVYLLHGEGIETGVDLDALVGVAEWLEVVLGRPLEGQVYRAGTFASVAG
jgi:hydroxymethylglutaryl-CoA lyase